MLSEGSLNMRVNWLTSSKWNWTDLLIPLILEPCVTPGLWSDEFDGVRLVPRHHERDGVDQRGGFHLLRQPQQSGFEFRSKRSCWWGVRSFIKTLCCAAHSNLLYQLVYDPCFTSFFIVSGFRNVLTLTYSSNSISSWLIMEFGSSRIFCKSLYNVWLHSPFHLILFH